jgi:hypothetical protein
MLKDRRLLDGGLLEEASGGELFDAHDEEMRDGPDEAASERRAPDLRLRRPRPLLSSGC